MENNENNENKDLEKARDLSLELFKVLMANDENEIVADLALTRLLAGLYSLQPPEVADKLIKLHYDNLRHSVREIRENKNTDKDGN